MKRILAILLTVFMVSSLLAVCVEAEETELENQELEIELLEKAPVIDGEITSGEYGKYPIHTFKQGEDNPGFKLSDCYAITDDPNLQIDFYAGWDEKNLYMAWKVKTKYDCRMPKGIADGYMYQYCCVQFILTTGAPSKGTLKYQTAEWSGDYLEIGCCLKDDNQPYKVCWSQPLAANGGLTLSYWEYAGSREGDITTYEVRLPWDKIGIQVVGTDAQFGLTYAVGAQKNYETVCHGLIEYQDAIIKGKHADSAAIVTLKKKIVACKHESAQLVHGKDATCTEDGLKAYWHCGDCLKNFVDSDFQLEIVGDLDTWRKIGKLGHDYKAVVTPPTCTEKGYTTHTCTCGDSYKDTYTDPLGHNYEWVIDKAATKTEAGLKHEECTRCHAKRNENTVIPILTCDHKSAQKVNGKDATCTEDGLKAYWHCGDCLKNFVDSDFQLEIVGDLDTWRKIGKLGHDYKAVLTPPTCTEKGYTTHTCTCGDSYKDTYTDPLGHNYEWVIDKAATKTEAGLKHEECTRCHAKRNENKVIPIVTCEHKSAQKVNGKDATCTEDGLKAYWHCGDCWKNFVDSDFQLEIVGDLDTWRKIGKLGHDYKAVVTPPTATKKGYTTHICERCHDTYVDSYTDPTGQKEPIKGDINGDGNVNAMDCLLLKGYILKTLKNATAEQIERMDLNGDKTINAVDYALLRAAVLGTKPL